MNSKSTFAGALHEKVGLVIGFWAVVVGTLLSHGTPATGYELSMYSMTPSTVWFCLGIGGLVGIYVALRHSLVDRHVLRAPALVLVGLSVLSFVGTPIIRGYHFNGHNDSLTHLGWASALGDGTVSPFELLYPGIHSVSVFVESVVAIPLSQSMLLVPVLATVVFFVFVPLAVRELTADSSPVVAAVCAFLILPITTITTNYHPHAMSQTILLSALPVYVLLTYVSERNVTDSFTADGALLFALTVATVVFHPQYVAHMIVALVGICAVQFVARRWRPRSAISRHRTVHGQLLGMIAVLGLWSANHGFFGGFVTRAIGTAVAFFLDGSGQAGSSVASQGASLQSIGGGIGEVFLKLFGPHLVVSLFAGGLILWVLFRGGPRRLPDVRAFTIYFAAALFNLGILFVVYFASQTSEMYFRVFGLMMVFVTVLGAVAIDRSLVAPVRRRDSRAMHGVVAVGCVVLVVASLLTVFPSPFVYNQSHHVTEMEMTGYESTLSSYDIGGDAAFVGFRNGPDRYADAIAADGERSRVHGSLTEAAFERGLGTYYEDETYVAITKVDYDREVRAYRGLRYSAADFESVDSQPGVNRLQANGEYELYHIPGEGR